VRPTLEEIVAVISLTGGFVVWLWRTASTVEKATIELGICKADVATLKSETQHLRDQSVRQSTLVETVMQQLAKLDQVDRLVSAVEAMRSTVDRLDALVVPRQEIEARFRTLEPRHD
jgi:hypothetical protein